MLVSRKRRELAKCSFTAFIDVDISRRMEGSANVVLHDIDLYFQGHVFLNVNISGTASAFTEMHIATVIIIISDVRHRTVSLQILYSVSVT